MVARVLDVQLDNPEYDNRNWIDDGPVVEDGIVYPDSDGKPMADNDWQWQMMVLIVNELQAMFDGQRVYVSGDLFWYPVEGKNKICIAPDAMVVFGRPPGYRRSYRQWREEGIAPQVVFEVLSHKNTKKEMDNKKEFYAEYGVQEYYVIDPQRKTIVGYMREGDNLRKVARMNGFTSPLMNITFETDTSDILIRKPDGTIFRSFKDTLADTKQKLKRERKEKDRMAKKLRELGIDPDTLK